MSPPRRKSLPVPPVMMSEPLRPVSESLPAPPDSTVASKPPTKVSSPLVGASASATRSAWVQYVTDPSAATKRTRSIR